MPQDFPPNYLPPDTYRPVDVPAVPNAPGTFVPQDFSPSYLPSQGGFGFGGGNGGGGFAGQVLGFTRDVAAIGIAGRVLGNTLGVASEFTGARIPLGGGYNGLERRQVAFQNTGYDAGIAYNRALTTSYNNFNQNGYGYNGGYGDNFAPQGFNGGGYGSQSFNGGNQFQNYNPGPSNQSSFAPRGGNRYADGGGQEHRGDTVPELNLITLADNVVSASAAGDQQAAKQYAAQFATSARQLTQRDGQIHVPGHLTWFATLDGRPVSAPVGTPEQVASRLLGDLNASPQARDILLGAVTGRAPQEPAQTVQTDTQTQQTQTQTGQSAAGASTSSPSTNTASTTSDLPPTMGKQTRGYGLTAQKRPSVEDTPKNLTKEQVIWLQQKLNEAGIETHHTDKQKDGVDGLYGKLTKDAIKQFLPAGAKLHDIDLAHLTDNATGKAFLENLNKAIATHKGQSAAPTGPTPEQKAEADRKAAEQKAAAEARAREDAAQGPLLNTAFDARKLPQTAQGRYAMAREALLDSGELKHDRKLHTLENMHDKMKEAVHDANKLMEERGLSKRFQSPAESQPFTDDAMQALGIVTKEKGLLRQSYGASVTLDPMQAALQRSQQQGVGPIDGIRVAQANPGDPAPGTTTAQGASASNGRVQQ